jgi:DNA polymerase-1
MNIHLYEPVRDKPCPHRINLKLTADDRQLLLTSSACSIHTENMENNSKRLLLIDGNALVHRAFHALPPLSVPKTGETVGAVYGFATMLLKAFNELKPSHIAVAFDRKAPTFRHQVYDKYKAQRPPMPEELAGQLSRVREVVNAFNIPIFEMDGYEADDILGTLSVQASAQNIPTVIVTGDADIMQLVSPAVKVFYPRPGGSFSDAILYDEEAVKARYGVSPQQIADLKALKGDPSDNIPGVPGVGEKTAQKLIQQFASVQNLIEHLDEVEPAKTRDKLKENLEQLKMSFHLTTINKQMPITLDYAECCRIKSYDRNKAAELFRELNFNNLVAKLPESQADTPADAAVKSAPELSYITVTTPSGLAEMEATLTRQSILSVHTEGNDPSPITAELTNIAISPAEGQAYFIAFKDNSELHPDTVYPVLKNILDRPGLRLQMHNAKYHMLLLRKIGINIRPAFDSQLAAYLLGDLALGLKELVFNRLGFEMNATSAKGASKQIALFEVDSSAQAESACTAADMTGRLSSLLLNDLQGQPELFKLYQDIELPLVYVLAEMEHNGIKLDPLSLKEMSERLGLKLEELSKEIYQAAGSEFNINSPQQLGVVLFEKMGLPGKKVHGKYSTDASVLEGLSDKAIVRLILEYRQLMKLKSTYIDALPALINQQTGRLHTSFNQTRTTTGRLSSSDPNLQNIPVRTELGRDIRKAFVAREGCILLAGDYSQIDLRVLAHLSGDVNLVQAFCQDQDIHSATAAQLYGVDITAVKPDMRRLAKTVNFGVIYGMSEFGLEQATELSRQEAGEFIKAYFNKYPGVARYLEETREQARKQQYVQTLLGHRRYIPEVNSPNRMIREGAERMAINMPVQGTSSDIIKIAMINIQNEIDGDGLKAA